MGNTRHLVTAASVALVGVIATSTVVAADTKPTPTIVPLVRTIKPLKRSVVPFDGRSETRADNVVVVSLDAQVLFAFDQADLTPQAQATLTDLATDWKDHLGAPAISIVGHTDAIGTDEYNQDLSTRRAVAVRDYLASIVTVPVELSVEGRGKTQPVAPNTNADGSDNPEGRRRNRRVEITYTSK